MKRSLPLAQFSVPGVVRSLASTTSHRPPATRHFAGFTLIELMVVMAVIAVVAAISIGTLGYVQKKGAISRAEVEVATLSAAIDRFFNDYGVYPSSAGALYSELTGERADINTNGVVYLEPAPGMVSTNGGQKVFSDPFGTPYNYNSDNPTRNVGFYDLYSIPPDAKSEADWIHN